MKKQKKFRSEQAFTLVELLMVIMIIGILAGTMMLILHSGNHAAEAAKIISDLRSLKSAAMLYYLDNPDGPAPQIDPDLKTRMDRPPDARYSVYESASGVICAQCDLSSIPSGIIDKLKKSDTAVELTSDDTIARIKIR